MDGPSIPGMLKACQASTPQFEWGNQGGLLGAARALPSPAPVPAAATCPTSTAATCSSRHVGRLMCRPTHVHWPDMRTSCPSIEQPSLGTFSLTLFAIIKPMDLIPLYGPGLSATGCKVEYFGKACPAQCWETLGMDVFNLMVVEVSTCLCLASGLAVPHDPI